MIRPTVAAMSFRAWSTSLEYAQAFAADYRDRMPDQWTKLATTGGPRYTDDFFGMTVVTLACALDQAVIPDRTGHVSADAVACTSLRTVRDDVLRRRSWLAAKMLVGDVARRDRTHGGRYLGLLQAAAGLDSWEDYVPDSASVALGTAVMTAAHLIVHDLTIGAGLAANDPGLLSSAAAGVNAPIPDVLGDETNFDDNPTLRPSATSRPFDTPHADCLSPWADNAVNRYSPTVVRLLAEHGIGWDGIVACRGHLAVCGVDRSVHRLALAEATHDRFWPSLDAEFERGWLVLTPRHDSDLPEEKGRPERHRHRMDVSVRGVDGEPLDGGDIFDMLIRSAEQVLAPDGGGTPNWFMIHCKDEHADATIVQPDGRQLLEQMKSYLEQRTPDGTEISSQFSYEYRPGRAPTGRWARPDPSEWVLPPHSAPQDSPGGAL